MLLQSNMDLSGGLTEDGVSANFGFFNDQLSVGGTSDRPNLYISSSGEISTSFFRVSPGDVTAQIFY